MLKSSNLNNPIHYNFAILWCLFLIPSTFNLVELLNLDDNELRKVEADISRLQTEIKAFEERKKQAMKKIEVFLAVSVRLEK